MKNHGELIAILCLEFFSCIKKKFSGLFWRSFHKLLICCISSENKLFTGLSVTDKNLLLWSFKDGRKFLISVTQIFLFRSVELFV